MTYNADTLAQLIDAAERLRIQISIVRLKAGEAELPHIQSAYADCCSVRSKLQVALDLLTDTRRRYAAPRKRGGPWRWRVVSDGRTGVIDTANLSDAKKLLRYKFGVKRLPNGIEWEMEP